MSEEGVNKTVANCEANNQEVLHIRAADKEKGDAKVAAARSEDKELSQQMIAAAFMNGDLVKEHVLVERAEQKAVQAIAAKKTQDANETWAFTKAAAAAHKPDKPFVAAARATEAAARSHQPSQSQSMSQKSR